VAAEVLTDNQACSQAILPKWDSIVRHTSARLVGARVGSVLIFRKSLQPNFVLEDLCAFGQVRSIF
jgi:hypothetical protein